MHFEIANIVTPLWVPVAWGILVGLVFSTVGAAGGILASVGLVSVLGIQDANLVKPTAQVLTLVTPLVAIPGYYRQCRVIFSVALILGMGSIFGALIGSTFSASYLADLGSFKPVFGLLVLLIAVQIGWQLWASGKQVNTHASRAASAFEGLVHARGVPCAIGVRHLHGSLFLIRFEFGGETFSYRPWVPFLAGLCVAVISSALGVGGGFLMVPFMTMFMGFPMFIVAATAALAVAVSSVTSVANYVRLGVELDVSLLVFLLAGTVLGSYIGPRLSKHLPHAGLNAVLCLVLLLIGLRYLGLL